MALGSNKFTLQPGGGQSKPSPALLARTLVAVGCSPLLTPNTLAEISDPAAIPGALDTCPTAEFLALVSRGGQTQHALAVNPSNAGAVGDVSQIGAGTGVIKVSLAPHKLVEILIDTAGALGTMKFKYRVGGVGSFSAAVLSTTPGPMSYRVPGTYCVLAFAAGTYVLASTYAIGVDGTITLGGSAINTVTFTASPLDMYEVVGTVNRAGVLGASVLGLSLDNGNGTLPPMLMPSTGVIVIPGTGIVLTCGQHVILITITTPGALGTAIYSYQVDSNSAVTGQATTPNSGGNYVVTIPGTGVTLTFTPGSYVGSSTYTINADGSITRGGSAINNVTQSWAGFIAGDEYLFLASPPTGSTSDYAAAYDAARAVSDLDAVLFVNVDLPSTAAGAISLMATTQTEMDTAVAGGRDWQAMSPIPCSESGGVDANGVALGDIVISGGKAARDSADTSAVIVAARGSDTQRVSSFAGTERTFSELNAGRFPLRPIAWLAADRFVDTDPKRDLGARDDGALRVFQPANQKKTISRDERLATVSLDDAQINTLQTDANLPGAYLSMTSGVGAWKNMTTQADYQRAFFLRVINAAMPSLRAVMAAFIGEDADVKPDGTITDNQGRAWDAIVDNVIKRATSAPETPGQKDMVPGSAYTSPQVASATGSILRTSQLGQAPRRLDAKYTIQSRGEVTDTNSAVEFSGTLSVTK